AYRQIHAPSSQALLEAAQRRISFEEFFIFSAGLQLCKARRAQQKKAPFSVTNLTAFYAALPFTLTGAQRRVIGEILQDFTRGRPMCRLVQGDVGSGKTMVAAAAIVCAAKNGVQSALLAPTEILAEQHFQSLAPLFERLGLRCGLLTGSQKASEKRALRAALQAGELEIVIGTHALLSGTTAFANLGLVVTDEQHRFGVAQRSALAQKGELPHLLLLSATPIPRTLSMILYGDLDVSILDEQPPGRQPVDTFLVSEALRPRINAFLRKQVEAGYQCFVICPAVEESETTELKSAEQWAEALRQALPELQIAVVHGQMKSEEKEEIMGAFAQGQTQILVATTVIEVGVDIPNANLIVIENADRFGLSQLHQLRGRVGRSEIKSYCIL
ncbi:MAG: ATP-dependent DNA helicase RecG, partial [Oscillospiraceae bacterium]|nr:ATP-dependent DNA helicase RecG [Oscillospiraceae bacterium]